MKICLISNGTSEHIVRLSEYLVSRKHEVHLLSSRKQKNISNEILFHTLNKFPAFWPFQARQIIAKINPDIVDGHFVSIYGFLAAISGFHPFVVTVWGSDIFINPYHNVLWKYTTKYAIRHADKIACLFSIDIAKDNLVQLGADIKKVETYYLGVDTSLFYRINDCNELKAKLGIDNPIIINPRGFEPVYGMETFIRSIPLVLDSIPEAKFIIIYKKSDKNKIDILNCQQYIKKSVKFIERVPHDQMPCLLSISDIFVSPSLSDGASNALFEAMACETSPIVTDISANRHWIKDGENGYLFSPGDYITLALRIVDLLKDKNKRLRFGKKSCDIVKNKAEQSDNMAKIEQVYQSLVQKYKLSTL
jgi:glycosyltransferase involved in cell wall biosynthesis